LASSQLMVSKARTCSRGRQPQCLEDSFRSIGYGAHTTITATTLSPARSSRFSDSCVRIHGPESRNDAVATCVASNRRPRRAVDLAREQPPLGFTKAFLAGVPVVASRGLAGDSRARSRGEAACSSSGRDADSGRGLGRLLTAPGMLDTLRAGIRRFCAIEDDIRMAREDIRRPGAGDELRRAERRAVACDRGN